MNLATIFYRNRYLLVCTIVVAVVAGVTAFQNIPRLEDPRLQNRNAIILTLFPGASAERVESLVTEKIEAQLLEIDEIKTLQSTSRSGVSSVSVELQDYITDANNEDVFSKIRNALKDAKQRFPLGVGEPFLDDTRTTAFTVLYALATKDNRLGIMQRFAVELANNFRNVPGTEVARIYGGVEEEYRVELNTNKAVSLKMTTAELQRALVDADVKVPAGRMLNSQSSIPLEVRGAFDNIQTIENLPLRGSKFFVRDIASVRKTWKDPPQDIAFVNDKRAIFIAARIQKNEQLHDWASAIHAEAKNLRRYLDDESTLNCVFDQSSYTYERLRGLYENFLMGCALVMLIIFIVMGWRSAIVVSFALPFSVAISLFVIMLSGEQLHQMSIFGMIIAVGLLIDNAIVVTDEVVVRIQKGCERVEAIKQTVSHLFSPLLASTFTTILGFMPVFLLSGNIGDFISSIAKSVVVALCASFIASMTVIPSLAALLTKRNYSRWWQRGVRSQWLLWGYQKILQLLFTYRKTTILCVMGISIWGFVKAGELKEQFFPGADRDQFEIQVWLPQHVSIHKTRQLVLRMEKELQKFSGIESTMWMVGNSFPTVYYNALMTKDNTPFYANAVIKTANLNAVRKLVPQIQQMLDRKFPEAQSIVRIFGQGPPKEAPLEFRIYGVSVEKLRLYGEKIRSLLLADHEVLHCQATITSGIPKLWLNVHRSATLTTNLTLNDVAKQVRDNLDGLPSGSVLEELEEVPVTVRYSDDYRRDFFRLATMDIKGVPLNTIGRLDLKPTTNAITRYENKRCNTVRAYLQLDALPIEVSKRIVKQLSEINLEEGYSISVGGNAEEKGKAVASLVRYVPVLMTLMVATLILTFSQLSLAFIIGCVAILSVGFGLLSLWGFSYPLGFNPFLGIAGLIGIALNDTIVVLAGLNALKSEISVTEVSEAVIECTRHILSTTLTTIGSFLPLVVFTGGTFWPPLAIVIIGGVFGATALSLIFVPSLFCVLRKVPNHK